MEWTRPETVGDIPPPCRAHTATVVDRRIFIFGGGQGHLYYNNLYILDTITRRWTHVPFAGPPQTSTTRELGRDIMSPSASDDESGSGAGDDARSKAERDREREREKERERARERDSIPRPRRAHTTVLYKNRLVVFGGGNGAMALNDVWVLDLSVHYDRMRWHKQKTSGNRPTPRGYHTANLVGNVMIVVGGSDGRTTFSDIYCLNLGMCFFNISNSISSLLCVLADTWHWSLVQAEKPYRRLAHSSTQIGSYLFIMGGHDGSQYTNDLLLFNLGKILR
jgi:hypothetical protein